jgi:hypothetical protein
MSNELLTFRRKVREAKYLLTQEMYNSDEVALHYSVNYLDLRRMLLEPINHLKFANPQEAVPLLVDSLPRFDPQINASVLKCIVVVAALLDVLNMIQKQYDSQLCKIMLRISDMSTGTHSVTRMFERGLLDVSASSIRDSIMHINGHRAKIVQAHRSELLFVLRCVVHTAKISNNVLSALSEDYDVGDFIEGVVRQNILDTTTMMDVVDLVQDSSWSCPAAVANMVYENIIDTKVNILAIERMDGSFMMNLILQLYRKYRRDPQDATSLTLSLVMCPKLSTLILLNMWHVRLIPASHLKLFVVCLIDIIKFVHEAQRVPGAQILLSAHNSRFVDSALQICCFLFSRRTDLLNSFLIKYVPIALLGCPMTENVTFLKTIFAMLETVPRFINYMGACWTPELGVNMQTLLSPEAYAMVKVKSVVYARVQESDSENKYTDNLTGCLIITPGASRCPPKSFTFYRRISTMKWPRSTRTARASFVNVKLRPNLPSMSPSKSEV